MEGGSRESAVRILVARIGAPHGVRGDVKLWSFTAEPAAVADYGPFESADGTRTFELDAIHPQKDFFVARFKGVADRDAAAALRNTDLYVPRERLPDTDDPSEFYHADLIGLAAVDRDGAPVGKVIAIQNYGAGDLIEVQPESGASLLLPFTEAMVPEVDVAGGRIVVVPPEELSGEDDPQTPSPLPLRGRSTAKWSGEG